jgi:hypothetical protein
MRLYERIELLLPSRYVYIMYLHSMYVCLYAVCDAFQECRVAAAEQVCVHACSCIHVYVCLYAVCDQENIELYKVAQNRSLCEMIRMRPRNSAEMLVVWGMGEVKVCVCVCVSMYVCTYIYIYIYIYMLAVWVMAEVKVYMYVCVCVCICVCMYMLVVWGMDEVKIFIYMYTYVCVYVCIMYVCACSMGHE